MLSAVRTHRATVATPVCYSIKFLSVINFLHADDQASKQPANMSCCRTTIVGSFMTGSIRSIQDKVINKGLACKCVIKLETWCVVLCRGPSNRCAVCVRCTEWKPPLTHVVAWPGLCTFDAKCRITGLLYCSL